MLQNILTPERIGRVTARIHIYSAYFSILYFFEIMYLMVLLFFVTGSGPALVAGAVLAPLLSYHIIMLYYGNALHRKIQLYLMDLHLALSVASIARALFWNTDATAIFVSFLFIRMILILGEPVLIYFLTDRTVIDQFQ